jgi:hypothetical protein
MHVQVDQSGKIEDTRVQTVLAFSNQISYAILIPAPVKRKCVQILRRQYPKAFYLRLFSASLFLLLKDYLDRLNLITIDIEYMGKEETIKGILLDLIRKTHPGYPKDTIIFQRVGKRSPAHKKAIETYRGKRQADKKILAQDILGLFQ